MPEISVIIPLYNRADMIGETINNMLLQSVDMELIVVDDGSTDNSAEVVESFGEKVRLIRQTNQGPGAARNAGFEASTGTFIQFMDSDDLASHNKLSVQLSALKQTGVDFAYCPWIRCTIHDRKINFLGEVLQARALPDNKSMLEWFISGWSLVFQNCLFRRSILEKSGKYRTDLMPSEDSEYFIRILSAGAGAIHTPECLVFYREHNVNKITASGTSAQHRANDWTKFLDITGNFLKDKLPAMKYSTKLAVASNAASHNRYCIEHEYAGLPANHPYSSIQFRFKNLELNAYALSQRIMRRIKKTPDYHPAFKSIKPDERHHQLVRSIGYENQ